MSYAARFSNVFWSRKVKLSLTGFLGIVPSLWLAGVVLLAIRARLFLGYWPRPHHPDPKSLPFDGQLAIHYLSIYPALVCVLAFPIVFAVFFNSFSAKKRLVLAGSYVIFWAVLGVLLTCPPVDFLNWFLD